MNKIISALLLLGLVVAAGCSSGGRFQINDPYDRATPVYYAPAVTSPCGG